MALFDKVPSEFDLRLQVRDTFFPTPTYASTLENNRIDFIISSAKDQLFQQAFLWAESKMNNTPLDTMFAQLLLTSKPLLDSGEIFPPKFLGVFNKKQIAFIEYHEVLPIFNLNDLNWSERPSGVSQKTVNTIAPYLKNKYIFQFEEEAELKKFIAKNFVAENKSTIKLKVNKNNFIAIYNKWLKDVYPSILIKKEDQLKQAGILPCDFFLADLISKDNKTLADGLKIVLNYTRYEIQVQLDLFNVVEFKDAMLAHTAFWSRYQRPPKKEYYEYILNRRELLVPQDIRERKGAFFTPQIWVEKAHEYLAKTLGENWQDEYYIWDCCAGTCNLLANLTNPYHVWASTLDQPDVNIVHEAIRNGNMNLLESHVFQFDFLNDSFDKLPQNLRDIINDEEKRKKLIFLINPPYAEATNSKTIVATGAAPVSKHKAGVSQKGGYIYKKYGSLLGRGINEVFAQFLIRIYEEFPFSLIAQFSKLKTVQSANFSEFRKSFLARLLRAFIVPANTFDNVKGHFPIGFFIWDTKYKENFTCGKADIFDKNNRFIDIKYLFATDNKNTIMAWIQKFYDKQTPRIAYMVRGAADFQNNKIVFITKHPSQAVVNHSQTHDITANNLLQNAIYFAVRHCIEATWINDRDQFLYPTSNKTMITTEDSSLFTQEKEIFLYEHDKDFQNDCIIFTLFYHQNVIKSNGQPNNWIPFSPAEVHAKDNFRSTFMYDYLKTRGQLTSAAQAVLDAGRALWTYYHETIKNDSNAYVDASLYEIREYFKGRNEKGRMNTKATDEHFNELDAALRHALKALAVQIQPKVYEYGFLRE